MLSIKMTKSHPVPAIYAGTEYLRDVGADLSRAAWQVLVANRTIAIHRAREARIQAARRALGICGKLLVSRERLTRKTMIAANVARRVL